MLEVAVIFVVIFGPEIIAAMAETGVTVGLGTVGTAALLFLINKDIYDNFCEMGELSDEKDNDNLFWKFGDQIFPSIPHSCIWLHWNWTFYY